jgi:hypothetical protein
MVTIIEVGVPCDALALSTTFGRVSGATATVDRTAESGVGRVMPLVWIRADDVEEVDDALAEDPTVSDAALLSDLGDRRLYSVEWADEVRSLVGTLTDDGGVVLDATADADRWWFRLLHPHRRDAEGLVESPTARSFPLDVLSIRETTVEPAVRHDLTDEQYRALVLAHERGYFSVPRETTLVDISEDLDVTHQALSERLRRGTEALIGATIADERRSRSDGSDPSPGESISS